MKRDMQVITDEEAKIKQDLETEGNSKQKYKSHCDKMKLNIKGNREKFKKQEREFEHILKDNFEVTNQELEKVVHNIDDDDNEEAK